MSITLYPAHSDIISLNNMGAWEKTIYAMANNDSLKIPRQPLYFGDRVMMVEGHGNFVRRRIYLAYILSEVSEYGIILHQTTCSTQGIEQPG